MKNKTLPDAIALLEARDWQGAHAIAQESDEPLFNAQPLPAGAAARPEIISHYFRNGIYPYDRLR